VALPRSDDLSERLKRVFDLVVACLGLAALAPVMAAVGALVRWRLGRPVLFRQERAGRDGRPFELVKFRTMRDARTADGRLLPDEERLTPLGEWLRSTSLDELPELVHVVSGRMSLVGPRPLPTSYLGRYSEEQARRHEVRPGITGWAQVNGRNATTWKERFAMDVWYVDHRSTRLDLRILGRTIGQVLARRDISHEGHATMTEFLGDGR
jgi:lipopolysaccharide/colanic/teichoic acid biosynthesis glycosyltransferase